MKEKLKKIFFWVLFGLSLGSLVLSLFASAKPEWFEWLPTLFGWDEATTNAILATFGFGGTAGTLGFSIAKASLSSALTNGQDLSKKTIDIVKNHTLDIVKEAKDNYKDILQKFTSQNETISRLVVSDENSKTAFEALAGTVKALIELEIINLNKTLDNPLVNEETKNKILEGLRALDLLEETEEKEEDIDLTDGPLG